MTIEEKYEAYIDSIISNDFESFRRTRETWVKDTEGFSLFEQDAIGFVAHD